MAWDYDRERVAIIGHANGAKGFGLADRQRNVGVSARFAIRDCQQGSPAG